MSTPAYKLTLLLTIRPGLRPADFASQWLTLEKRDPVDLRGLVRHVFGQPIAGAGAPIEHTGRAPFQAVQETWWERKNDAADWVVSHEFDAWLERRMPLLSRRPDAVGGQPTVLWERPDQLDSETAVKVIILPVAKRSLTVRQFVDHWTGHHAELALAGPDTKERLVRLEVTPAQSTPSRFVTNLYDGVGAVTFESADAAAAEFSSSYYKERLAPDEPNFTDPHFSQAFLTSPVALR